MKIIGTNLYLRYLQSTEVDMLTASLNGLWKDNHPPTTRETSTFAYGTDQANAHMFSDRSLQDGDLEELVLAICASDDTLIGYNISVLQDLQAESLMTALLPDFRGLRNYSEFVDLRHRLIFDELGASRSLMKIPMTGEHPVKAKLDPIYINTVYEFMFQDNMWRLGELTEPEFRTYVAANPDNHWTFTWAT